MRRRWLLVSVAAAALAGGCYLFRGFLLERTALFLIEEDPPAKADAIVVLAGSVADRALEAVALYREGYAPRIVFSRPPASPVIRRLHEMGVRFPDPSQLGRSVAEQLGVPAHDIVEIGGTGQSTYTEAEVVLHYVEARGYDTILLVTSKVHSRRAATIFRHLARGRCRIVVRPSRYDPFQPSSWWHDRMFQRRVVFEYQKLAVFYLLDRWRLGAVAFSVGWVHYPMVGDERRR